MSGYFIEKCTFQIVILKFPFLWDLAVLEQLSIWHKKFCEQVYFLDFVQY